MRMKKKKKTNKQMKTIHAQPKTREKASLSCHVVLHHYTTTSTSLNIYRCNGFEKLVYVYIYIYHDFIISSFEGDIVTLPQINHHTPPHFNHYTSCKLYKQYIQNIYKTYKKGERIGQLTQHTQKHHLAKSIERESNEKEEGKGARREGNLAALLAIFNNHSFR
jgi:hypothetical protein